MSDADNPYIRTERVVVDLKYNPDYGDDRKCVCGHPYYRHFDTYEDMDPVGCKYCGCYLFVEDTGPESHEEWLRQNPHMEGSQYEFKLED